MNISKVNFKSIGINIAKVDFGAVAGGDIKKDYMYFTCNSGTATVDYARAEYVGTHGSYLLSSSDGNNWSEWVSKKTILPGTKLYVKGNYNFVRNLATLQGFFRISGNIECHGNIMSLCNFSKVITSKYCFASLFKGCNIMTAPELPAKILADNCYRYMFSDCTALTEPPVLPATNLTDHCYANMFQGCTGLTTAPALPALELAPYCYNAMFQGCTSIVKAPDIIATKLADSCYVYMFYNCSNLNKIKLTGDHNIVDAASWVLGVAGMGTFFNYSPKDIPEGSNGVPEGWVVVKHMPGTK